ncbi:phosphoribosylformylglycinamidine synthase, partial [Coemansia sp. RSA 2702]
FPFPVGAIAQRQTHNAHFVDFDPVYTETAYVHTAAMSEYTPAVVEALLPITHKNVWAIIATLLRAPGKSGAPQATIQRVLDDHDSDSEKRELADKERELRVLPRRGTISPWSSTATDIFGGRVECGIVYCIAFADDLVIPQFRPLEYKQIINAGPDRMAEPSLIIAHSEPRPLREAPIRNIDVVQVQGGAEQNEGTAINVLAQANRELGLTLAIDEITYLVDAYLGAQVTDAGVAHNPMGAALVMFAQVNSEH